MISRVANSSKEHEKDNDGDEEQKRKGITNTNVTSIKEYISGVCDQDDISQEEIYYETNLVISSNGIIFETNVSERLAMSNLHMVKGRIAS